MKNKVKSLVVMLKQLLFSLAFFAIIIKIMKRENVWQAYST